MTSVLFDLYDTLAWIDWPYIREGRTRLAELARVDAGCYQERCDLTVASRTVGGLGGPAEELTRLLSDCGGQPDAALVDRLVELDRETWRRGVQLFDDALASLRRLRRRGCRLGIISNCSWQGGEVVRALGLDREVDAVVLSFEVGAQKPQPAMFAAALERLPATPFETVLVDDLARNLDAARELGVQTLLLDRRLEGTDADHRRLGALLEIEGILFA